MSVSFLKFEIKWDSFQQFLHFTPGKGWAKVILMKKIIPSYK